MQTISATVKALANIEVVTLVECGKLDVTSLAGKLMLNMLAAVAEMKWDLLVKRMQSELPMPEAQGETLEPA